MLTTLSPIIRLPSLSSDHRAGSPTSWVSFLADVPNSTPVSAAGRETFNCHVGLSEPFKSISQPGFRAYVLPWRCL